MSEKGVSHTSAERVRAASARVATAVRVGKSKRVKAIDKACSELKAAFTVVGKRYREDLASRIREAEVNGFPPPFIRISGQRRLEKPYNRLLGWWANPLSEHGMGLAFLQLLADELDLEVLREDLREDGAELEVEVFAERAVPGSTSNRQPDLLVLSRRSALLLENKVGSGESGEGQYRDYLDLLETDWGHSKTERLAVLGCRYEREAPQGYREEVLLHSRISRILEALSRDQTKPVWGRIAARICAVSFGDERPGAEILRDAKATLAELDRGEEVSPQAFRRIISSLKLPDTGLPWEDEKHGC